LNRFRRHHFPVMPRSSLSLRIFPLLGEPPFRLVVDTDERTATTDRGLIPALVYALTVIQDSKGRFAPGDWVRSTLEVSFTHDCLFETKNTVYVLMGAGRRLRTDLDIALSLC